MVTIIKKYAPDLYRLEEHLLANDSLTKHFIYTNEEHAVFFFNI